jgi:hypothetical protein
VDPRAVPVVETASAISFFLAILAWVVHSVQHPFNGITRAAVGIQTFGQFRHLLFVEEHSAAHDSDIFSLGRLRVCSSHDCSVRHVIYLLHVIHDI